ncbi:MAG: tetratricopeptide repeat protein [bacterium]
MKIKFVLIALVSLLLISSCGYRPSRNFKTLMRTTEQVLNTIDTAHLANCAMNFVLSGSKFQQEGLYAESIIEFQQALQCDTTASIYYALGSSYLKMGKVELAIQSTLTAIKLNKTFTEAYKLLADCYIVSYDLDAAITTYEELVRFYPGYDAKFSLARLYDLAGNTEKAMALYDNLYTNNDDYNSLVRIAELSYMKGDSARYLETLLLAHKANPEDEQSALMICEFYSEKKNYPLALSFLSEVEPYLSSENLIKCFDGLLINLLNDSLKVSKQYSPELISKIDNRFYFDSETMIKAGFLAQRIGDSAKTDLYLNIALNISDSIPDLPIQLALFYSEHNNNTKAMDMLNKYEPIYPKYWAYPFYKSMVLVETKEIAKSLVNINRADSLKPNNSDIMGQMAFVYQLMKDYPKSDSLFEILLQKSPNNPLLCNNYAYSLAERGENLTLAHKLIQIAIEKSPTNSSFLDTYGWVKFKMGDYDIALQYALDALKYSDTKNAEIYEHIGDIYKAKGDTDEAVYYWDLAIKLNPPNSADINKKITNAKK